jgi:hypothetical protein
MNPELAQAPASGRRRQTPVPKARSRRGSPSWLAAVGVALIGAALVLTGGLKATVLAPPDVTVATLSAPGRPVVSTAVGLLGLEGPRVEVDATAGTANGAVFVGIGRAHDVDAYLAQVSRFELTGDRDGTLLTKPIGTEPTLPDPAAADVWLVSARGPGAASLVWPQTPGQWRLVIATDGTAPAAAKITLSWSGRDHRTAAPALISIGLVLVVGGLITLIMLGSRARLAADE